MDESKFLKEANLSAKVFRMFYYQPILGLDDMIIEAAAERDLALAGDVSIGSTRASVVTSLSAAAAATQQNTSVDSESADAVTFVVASIKDRRTNDDGALCYLVHWEGFSSDDETWEPVAHLDGAREAVAAFESRREASLARRDRRLALLAPMRHPPVAVQTASSGRRSSAPCVD